MLAVIIGSVHNKVVFAVKGFYYLNDFCHCGAKKWERFDKGKNMTEEV